MPENPTLYDRTVCSCIIDTAPLIEAELRKIGAIKRDLSGLITQGAYSTSVSASAGTHAGGGVIDVRYSLTDTDAKRRAWAAGAAIAFPRTRILGLWPSHGHVVWRGCPHLAASAARQVTSYLDGRNGLKSNAPLGYPAVPVPTVQQILAPKPAPKPPAPKPAPPSRPRVSLADVQTQARRRRRSVSEHVRTVQRALLAENIRTVGPADGWWGPRTTEAYAYWQHWLGYRGRAADGIPGRVTLARLGQRQGFDVVS